MLYLTHNEVVLKVKSLKNGTLIWLNIREIKVGGCLMQHDSVADIL